MFLYSSLVLQGQSLGDDVYASHCLLAPWWSLPRVSLHRCYIGPREAPIPAYIVGQVVSFDVPPTVIQGGVPVPLRGIFERLGQRWTYDARMQDIVALRGL